MRSITVKKMNSLLLRTLVFACAYIIALSRMKPLLTDIYNGKRLSYLYSYLSYYPRELISLNSFVTEAMQLLVGIMSLYMALVSLTLFFFYGIKNEDKDILIKDKITALGLLILNGIIIRLCLAYFCYGNYDMSSYELVTAMAQRGANIYAETSRYNYTPIWLHILLLLKYIQLKFLGIEFHFIVKVFLCLVDLVTLYYILMIAKSNNLSVIKTTLFFFFNPILFLITGYHGQFENLAILMVVIGIFCYLRLQSQPNLKRIFYWIFSTLGMMIKHNIFYQLIICLNYCFKRINIRVILFIFSVLLFFVSFSRYWSLGWEGIVRNVLLYSSSENRYGITSLLPFPLLKYLFVLGLCIFPFLIQKEELIKQALLGMLFFLVFTTGMAAQYLVLPLAFGCLRPSKGLLFYTLAGTLFLLGCSDNVELPIFDWLGWNIVWIGAIYWFVNELWDVSIRRKDSHNKVMVS